MVFCVFKNWQEGKCGWNNMKDGNIVVKEVTEVM